MRELSRKDSLIGATLKINSYSEKLDMFDKALEKLYAEKVSHAEVLNIKFDHDQSQLFQDFRDLLDSSMEQVNDRIDDL
jgi:phosphopentomutase